MSVTKRGKVIVDSTTNGIWLRVQSPEGDATSMMLDTSQVDELVSIMKEALAHGGHWELPQFYTQ